MPPIRKGKSHLICPKFRDFLAIILGVIKARKELKFFSPRVALSRLFFFPFLCKKIAAPRLEKTVSF